MFLFFFLSASSVLIKYYKSVYVSQISRIKVFRCVRLSPLQRRVATNCLDETVSHCAIDVTHPKQDKVKFICRLLVKIRNPALPKGTFFFFYYQVNVNKLNLGKKNKCGDVIYSKWFLSFEGVGSAVGMMFLPSNNGCFTAVVQSMNHHTHSDP